jgi:hypothetical protein
MTDEKRETDLVLCEACQEMIRPVTEHAVCLVAATVITKHACPHCGGSKVLVASPSVR